MSMWLYGLTGVTAQVTGNAACTLLPAACCLHT